MDVRIGITTSFEQNEQRLDRAYVQAIERAGALPLIVPILESDDALEAFVSLIDGLVLPGGPAITEGMIGERPDDLNPTDPVRLHHDRRVLRAFLRARKPVLGICYGMQLINAEAGGTIYGDVERQREGILGHAASRGAGDHPIRLTPGTHLHRLLGQEQVTVNTRHIQALASVGEGFRVAATAPDGVIEAIENEEGTVLGVQFHPETLGDRMAPLFRHLVEQARRCRQTVHP